MAKTIQTFCPYCGGELEIDPEWVGRKAQCSYCQRAFIISFAPKSTSGDAGVPTSREVLSPESDNCDSGGDPNTDDPGSSSIGSTGGARRERRFPVWKLVVASIVAVILLNAVIVWDAVIVWAIVAIINSGEKNVSLSVRNVAADKVAVGSDTNGTIGKNGKIKAVPITEKPPKKGEQRLTEKQPRKEEQTKRLKQISGSIVCCNLADNSRASRTKSISFLDRQPKYRCLKVRFTRDPKKADATFYFGYFEWEKEALKITYTDDPSRADKVYNVVDSNPYWSQAEKVVYIVEDESTPVDMTLCITYDKSNENAIKIQEPIITSASNQQRVAIMYMLGFFK